METIQIKYFTDKIDKLTYIDGKSDWIDLRAAEDVDLKRRLQETAHDIQAGRNSLAARRKARQHTL